MSSTLRCHDLVNKNGIIVGIIPYGASVQKILLPTKDGLHVDVVQGYDSLAGYQEDKVYYGCTVGRFANRISNAKFTLDNHEYQLTQNRPGLCLHGGKIGFNKCEWKVICSSKQTIVLELTSPDGDEGFPGELTVRVTYCLSDDDELHLKYAATTSKPTVLNMTNHSYFNLAGHSSGSVLDHQLQIFADKYLPKGSNTCPTGELLDCAGSYDFRNPVRIGDRINDYPAADRGIDCSFLVRGWQESNGCHECKALLPAAKVVDPASGRWLFVSTTDPDCHIYTANNLNGVHGKNGAVHEKYSAFCVETHRFPDAPNHPHFPSTVLRPGEQYTHHTVWKFGGF